MVRADTGPDVAVSHVMIPPLPVAKGREDVVLVHLWQLATS